MVSEQSVLGNPTIAITRSMGKGVNQGQEPINSAEASSNIDPPPSSQGRGSAADLEMMIKAFIEDYGARIENNNQQQIMRVAENTRAISEISDLLSGLSLQMNQLMADRMKRGDSDNSMMDGRKSPIQQTELKSSPSSPQVKLGEMIGNPHQYSSRLTIEFPRFGGDELKA